MQNEKTNICHISLSLSLLVWRQYGAYAGAKIIFVLKYSIFKMFHLATLEEEKLTLVEGA